MELMLSDGLLYYYCLNKCAIGRWLVYRVLIFHSSIVLLSSEKLMPTNTFLRLSSAKAEAYFLSSI